MIGSVERVFVFLVGSDQILLTKRKEMFND